AEDGIRDFHVTGVQTCALPIFDLGGGDDLLALEVDAGLAGRLDGSLLGAETLHKNGAGVFTLAGDAEVGFTSAHVNAGTLVLVRSEERRVGKECRSGGMQANDG